MMLPDWSETTLFLHGTYSPSAEEMAAMARRGACVESVPIARIDGLADVDRTTGPAASGPFMLGAADTTPCQSSALALGLNI